MMHAEVCSFVDDKTQFIIGLNAVCPRSTETIREFRSCTDRRIWDSTLPLGRSSSSVKLQ